MQMRALACAAVWAASGVASAGQLVAVGGFDPFGTQSLYSIDSATGAATLIGDTGVRKFVGIEFNASTNTLYGLTTSADLYRINIFTGAASLVANLPTSYIEGDLAYDANGTLWGADVGVVGTVNTGNALLLPTALTALGDVSGLAFSASGALLAFDQSGVRDAVYRIDTATGATTLVGLTGTQSEGVGALESSADFGTVWLVDGSSLYTLNQETGTASLIGATGVSGISGLALVPAPGAAAVLALGGVVAGRRRRA